MKVLVTGATGFAGGHVLRRLMKEPALEVIAACRDAQSLPADFRGEVRCGDLRDGSYMARLLDGVDTVCHCAGWTAIHGHGPASARLYLEPSLQLLVQAKLRGTRRFINTSTVCAGGPDYSADARSLGIPRAYWPHLNSHITVENLLRSFSDERFTGVNLRFGFFVGAGTGINVLHILLPRLLSAYFPWFEHGSNTVPLIDGEDVGQVFARAVHAPLTAGYHAFNIAGPEMPTLREFVTYLHDGYRWPRPRFSLPFDLARLWARLLEVAQPWLRWREPLITRSIVHMFECGVMDNHQAFHRLGYSPRGDWRRAVDAQLRHLLRNPSLESTLVQSVAALFPP